MTDPDFHQTTPPENTPLIVKIKTPFIGAGVLFMSVGRDPDSPVQRPIHKPVAVNEQGVWRQVDGQPFYPECQGEIEGWRHMTVEEAEGWKSDRILAMMNGGVERKIAFNALRDEFGNPIFTFDLSETPATPTP